MTDPVQIPAAEIRQCLDDESLREWVQHQRWYASKSRARGRHRRRRGHRRCATTRCCSSRSCRRGLRPARTSSTSCRSACERSERADAPDAIARTEDWTVYDALADPAAAARAAAADGLRRGDRDRRGPLLASIAPTASRDSADDATVRPIGVEQSNSSIVFDDELVLKVFRKLEAGNQPRARDAALPDRARASRTSRRCTAGTSTRARRCRRRSASRRRSSPTPAAAGSWRSSEIEHRARTGSWNGSATSAGSPRELHNVLASDAGDPAFCAGGAQPGGAVAADRDRRRGHRADLPAAARRRAPSRRSPDAARTCASVSRLAPRSGSAAA